MITQQSDRFKDAKWFNPDKAENVIVGGVGGIGSWLTLFLSSAGYNPVIFDDDRIEPQNIGGQLFYADDLYLPKVQAIASIVKELRNQVITTFNEKFTEESPFCRFMFSCFDNMKARETMFNKWCEGVDDVMSPLFIDGRLEMEQLQIFCVTPENADQYRRTHMFSDSAVPDAPCTLRQTSHCAALIGSMMTGFFTNHMYNINIGAKVRSVPFYTEYFIPTNGFSYDK